MAQLACAHCLSSLANGPGLGMAFHRLNFPSPEELFRDYGYARFYGHGQTRSSLRFSARPWRLGASYRKLGSAVRQETYSKAWLAFLFLLARHTAIAQGRSE